MPTIRCVLADPEAVLPMPDQQFRPFSAEGEDIDPLHPFWAVCLADGSVVPADAAELKEKRSRG